MRGGAGEITGLKIPGSRKASGQAFQHGCLSCKGAQLHSLVHLQAAEPQELAAHTPQGSAQTGPEEPQPFCSFSSFPDGAVLWNREQELAIRKAIIGRMLPEVCFASVLT